MANYYNVDDILAEDEAMTSVFQVKASGVGMLDPGSESNCVEAGSKVDLPFWLAQELQMRQAVALSLPACFSQRTKKEVQADAACVDLRSRNAYFYELGCKIFPLVSDKSIGPFLLYTFTSRYKELLCKAHSAPVSTSPKYMPRLTHEETQMFRAAQSSIAAFRKWRVGGSRLEKASILGRKRRVGDSILE